jgi:hypothetical protein
MRLKGVLLLLLFLLLLLLVVVVVVVADTVYLPLFTLSILFSIYRKSK